MSFNPEFLNLFGEVRSPEWFKEHELRAENDDVIVIVPSSIPKPQPLPSFSIWDWGAGIFEGMKHWTGRKEDPTGIFAVSQTLDHIAKRLLQQASSKSKAALKNPSLDQRLELVRESYQELKNLELNLKNHNAVVEEFNQRFFFKDAIVGCPTHAKILKQVEKKLSGLKKAVQDMEKMKKSEEIKAFGKLIEELKQNLANGLQMTKEVLLTSYPLLLDRAKQLGLDSQKNMIVSLNQLFNRSYIQYLVDSIKLDQIPLPLSFENCFVKLGIDPEEAKKKISSGKNQLVKQLETYLTDNELADPPPELAQKIQRNFLNMAASLLASGPQQADVLRPFIEKIYHFEMDMQRLIIETEHEEKESIEEVFAEAVPTTEEDKKIKEIFLNKWRRHAFPSILPDIMKELFSQIDFDVSNVQRLETVIQAAKKKWSKKKVSSHYLQQSKKVFDIFIQEAKQLAHIPTWKEKNAHAQRFSFNQSAWGEQQIFGEGACAAINYRWIRRLLQNPSLKITSVEDLNVSNKDEQIMVKALIQSEAFKKATGENEDFSIDFSEVKPEDRITQATYQVERRLGAPVKSGSIGTAILKRDHMRYETLERYQPTIESLIDSLMEKHRSELTAHDTGGLVDIGIYAFDPINKKFSNGHAMGMQIDPTRYLYRFWDVNSGFYQYSSLEEMKTAMKEYMDEFYEGEYNYFEAGQYSPLS